MNRQKMGFCFVWSLAGLIFFLGGEILSAAAREKVPVPVERPVVPAARAMVLEVLVPSKMLKNVDVLETVMRTDRSEFVAADMRPFAFQDVTLPIGAGQTISPPFVVAYMTETIDPKPTDSVLEIGTGSGYQAAILSPLVRSVYTIEIVPTLGKKATETLRRLRYENVHVRVGDGYAGWPEAAPFDKIIVTCSPENIPQPLIDQLAEGGTMLIPVGERYHQYFYRCTKKNGELEKETLIPAFFVPMTGEAEKGRKIQPDPLNPSIRGGDFEEIRDDATPAGWYYTRNVAVKKDLMAPSGEGVLVFDNLEVVREQQKKDALERKRLRGESPRPETDVLAETLENSENGTLSTNPTLTARQRSEELTAHALQGFPVDGRSVRRLTVSCQMEGIGLVGQNGERAILTGTVGFFDANREHLGDQVVFALPPGDTPWRAYQNAEIRVPAKSREGSLRLGILHGVGVLKVDAVELQKK